MRNLFAAVILSTATCAIAHAQTQAQSSWSKVQESAIPSTGTRYIRPLSYQTFYLNTTEMQQSLSHAKRQTDPSYIPVYVSIPYSDGTIKEYLVYENETMSEQLASEFPGIRSYDGIAMDHSGDVVKLDFTLQGFHAMIMRPGKSTVYIDPYAHLGDQHYYIIYGRDQFVTDKTFECSTETPLTEITDESPKFTVKSYGGCQKRTYRLALSATAEYTAFHGGTVAQAQSAQVTTMNRVNGVYMREMAITMTIIGSNASLIFTNSSSDPFTNGDPDQMINQNQTYTNTNIGSANYDIGHVFGTNSGGLAGLGVVCQNSQKASGVTGSGAPIGDSFDIDYVAHEMGHQFDGNHTFRNCGGNENGATAYEPGSGSTIMAYAGICGATLDVQSNSDDYFHGVSIQEIGTFVNSSSHTCPIETAIPSQTAPDVSTSGNVTIPANTPFALTATATDADGDVLTYCWEQMNSQNSTQPPVATSTNGPNFRSFDPSTSPTRYFPRISAILAGTPAAVKWEKLPSVDRTMNFRVVVRDNEANGGCNDEANLSVTTTTAAGPFNVLYPTATGVSWQANSTQTVTWSVNNTDIAPVSCALVDIIISTDGGSTFSVILADTPNDGTESIQVPNTPTSNAIIMVQCANGTFFDISNNVFAITAGTPCNQPDVPTISGATSFCAGSNTTLSIGTANLNDATQWSWYSGGCGSTAAGTGTSISVSTPGTYYVRGTGGCVSGGSCVSVVVTQTSINTGVSQSSGSLTAAQSGGTYVWLDCANGNAVIPGATSQSYTPSGATGSYAVQVTTNGCTATSSCFSFSVLGIEDFNAEDVQLYPNPTNGIVIVTFTKDIKVDEMNVTDVTGRLVVAKTDLNSDKVQIDLIDESKGVYFMNVKVGDKMHSYKIVKD